MILKGFIKLVGLKVINMKLFNVDMVEMSIELLSNSIENDIRG